MCSFCHAPGATVTFEGLEQAVSETIGQFYVSVSESGAYHDAGEWSERVHDIESIASDLLEGAVAWEVQRPLTVFVAERNAVEYGFVVKGTYGRACTSSMRAPG